MTVVAVVIVVAIVACWVVVVVRRTRRSLTSLAGARTLLDTEIVRRHEQTDTLVRAARAVGVDAAVVTPLAGARSFAGGVRERGLTMGECAGAENALSLALHAVIAATTTGPHARTDWAVQRPVHDLQTTEQRLIGAARVYNAQADAVNALVRGIPAGPIARLAGAHPAPLFEAPSAAVDDVPDREAPVR